MKRTKRTVLTYTAAAVVCCLAAQAGAQTPLGSGWTYQGKLNVGGSPLNDTADFEFTLWDADVDGNMVGSVVEANDVDVIDGLFTVELDFGVSAFNGEARWLGIAVRSPAGSGEFTPLDPRQPLTAIPYALQTQGLIVDDANNVTLAPNNNNSASGSNATVGGGSNNSASGNSATVGGGSDNSASANSATVGGGFDNTASGSGSTVPGGSSNTAAGRFSFAAGRDAKANHNGTFVWADNADVDFASTGPDQFLIRAAGGVGIGTNAPATELEVEGTVTATSFVGDGSGLTGIAGGDPSYGSSAGSPDDAVFTDDAGHVGIGETSPSATLDVVGTTELNGDATINGELDVTANTTRLGGDVQIRGFAGGDVAFLRAGDDGSGSTDLQIRTRNAGANVNAVRIGSNGHVGIGTPTPAAKLEVAGTPGVDGIMFPDGTLQTSAAIGANSEYLKIGPGAFVALDSNDRIFNHSLSGVWTPGGGNMLAPVQLPAGARILSVTAYVRDEVDQDLRFVLFRKNNLSAGASGTGVDFDTSGDTGYFSVTFDGGPTINASEAYFFVVIMNGGSPGNNLLAVNNILVEWTMAAE